MAFYPRVRARSLESRVRTWSDPKLEKSSLLGFAGYKVTNLNVLSVDDREKTPNFGKNIMNSSTLIATPPLKIIGIRAYTETTYGKKLSLMHLLKTMTNISQKRHHSSSRKENWMKSMSTLTGLKR